MPDSAIIDLAIGLIFLFGVTAAVAAVATELIARLLGLRGAYLLNGLRELLDGGTGVTDLRNAEADYQEVRAMVPSMAPFGRPPAAVIPAAGASAAEPPPRGLLPSATGALLGSPILNSQGVPGQISSRRLTIMPTTATGRLPKMAADPGAGSLWSQRRSLPSYISSRSFAEAVIDLVVPDPAGPTTMSTIEHGVEALPDLLSPFKPSLQVMVKNFGGDVGQFRTAVEHWYDDHMDRVSGWYKRHVGRITLVVGVILIVLFNINLFTIGHTLYADSVANSVVSTVAAKGTSCPGESLEECLANAQAQVSAVTAADLPIGWDTVRDCREPGAQCSWLDQRGIFSRHGSSGWQFVLVLIGFLITIIAIVPGARFLFDVLGWLGSLRETGPKPARSES